jgi:hypothetical protein
LRLICSQCRVFVEFCQSTILYGIGAGVVCGYGAGRFTDEFTIEEVIAHMANDTEQSFNSAGLNVSLDTVSSTVHDGSEELENHAAVQAKLRAAAPDAVETLAKLMKGEIKASAAELAVIMNSAKSILDRAGHGPSAGAPPPGAQKDFSRAELEQMMQAMLASAGDKALPVTIDAQQAVSDLLG